MLQTAGAIPRNPGPARDAGSASCCSAGCQARVREITYRDGIAQVMGRAGEKGRAEIQINFITWPVLPAQPAAQLGWQRSAEAAFVPR